MKIRDLVSIINLDLENTNQVRDFNKILSEIMQINFKDAIISWDKLLSAKQNRKLKSIWKKYQNNYPLEYILNKSYFYNTEVLVNKNVLIPRVETELLVEEIINFINLNYQDQDVLLGDVCTGSGAIAVACLTECPRLKVIACDISKKALRVAEKNFMKFNSESYKILQGDFLEPLKDLKKVNIISVNPPYISKSDENVSPKTFKYEPHLALFAKEQGLYFYKKFFDEWKSVIDFKKPFLAVLEFGFQQKNEIEKLAKINLNDFNWEIKKDYSQNWRYLVIK